ncbi:MAG: ribosome recycling factor [Candidatus Andersenbacteria bacterium RIFCSPHIGHO2_12_FULL_46_9]|nr:MAG: Ribosome-recycling factor [Parcubacteria group bacterium GW2011_GWA2_45_14]OGY34792.1 MAG: ribosome recycling factor [Candidatus Andersenbacteria bacterium RIFCSPHIGHO2_02_FULL_46_16]OGY35926.1 MAG: ribosome recycling factor [Candidatus Andersenbacteria bacterium RIFCSPHIGHO2_12_FULL_46_9]OGY38146.1 MAG: ribosome recycling factor [Candidatus Andersenbacteria bacterium RIFCSPLOWO2_02_FULL_46_11]OGY40144.1 MAG: ribosome recycling factor [Candidatus Andersenbacteria bacterium RIFCSPLOWO2_1
MSLKENLDAFDQQEQETMEWFQREISHIRTGRVTPEMVAHVNIEHYGAMTPLNGLASINNTDARTLVIAPWDKGVVAAIERALTEAQLGVMPIVDGEIIRIVFPSLTEEGRERTVKQLNHKTEEARVRLRQARDEELKKIKDDKEKGVLTEDNFYEGKKELDDMIDRANQHLEDLAQKKEKEIITL